MKDAAAEIPEFSFSDFDSADEATMTVVVNGKPTSWVWTFAGPGHPQAVAQDDRLSRQRLHDDRLKEQAQVNGKKWHAADETVDEIRARNITYVIERIIGWSPVKIDGALLEFTPDNARKLLADRRKGELLVQALEFIGETNNFTQRSAIA